MGGSDPSAPKFSEQFHRGDVVRVREVNQSKQGPVLIAANVSVFKVLGHLAPHAHILHLPNERFSRDPKAVEAMDEDPSHCPRDSADANYGCAGSCRRAAQEKISFDYTADSDSSWHP